LMVPFETTPANPDDKLEEKLKAEWSAILRWCLDGCLDWQRDGLRPPASVQEATTDYLKRPGSVRRFPPRTLRH
jgi:putative DNA primase/helicase